MECAVEYPFWDIDIGYGVLMAIISVLHVFVSHFAIGGGLYLVVTETIARNRNDQLMLGFVERLTRFFLLVTVVFGAVSGVGIWFVIGLLNPQATELLIHNFVWGWAIEWTFFITEIAAIIIYFYGWKTMSARSHLTIGWIYFVAAWLSLAVINGILSFMLTPGKWIETGGFWDGFLNPTYFSTLVFRTGVCLLLAGVFAMVVSSRYSGADRARLVRFNALWAVIGMAIMVPTMNWFIASIPPEIVEIAKAQLPTATSAMNMGIILFGVIAVCVVLFGLLLPRLYSLPVAIVVMLVALLWFGEFEWMRESIRKPYIVTGYMYANALEVSKLEKFQDEGMLANLKYRTGDDGVDLFRHACRSCHTIDGYKPLARVFDGTDPAYIAAIVHGVHSLKGNMPPFGGTREEAELVAAHIYNQVDRRPFEQVYPLTGVELGRKVYDVRCGVCHVIGGYNDKFDALVGLSSDDYHFMLDMSDDLGEEMPGFTGSEAEREALVQYLLTLQKEGAGDNAGL